MTYEEAKQRLENGEKMMVTFYTKGVVKTIGNRLITDKQFEKLKPLCNKFKNNFGGFTTHYYWIEN